MVSKALPALFAAAMVATAAAQSTVRVVWNPNPESNVNKYNVLFGTSSGSLSFVQSVANPAATLSGLSPSTTYYCAVEAVNTDNLTSPRSSVISFTTSPGTSTAPEIAVERSGGNLTDGSSSVNFGSVQTGSSSGNQTFTIRNVGSANLTGLSTSMSGGQTSDFIDSGLSTSTLAPGASTTFTVRFSPGSTGSRSTTLRIASNDANENPFDISLSGTGTSAPPPPPPPATAPEIAVERSGGNLTDGSSSVNFGSVQTGSSSGNQTFTIRNLGDANLTGLSTSMSGGQTSDFIDSGLSTSTLAPGASTTFTVRFSPGSTGSRSTTLRIASNDANENPFDISLSGTGTSTPPPPAGTAPEIAIQRENGRTLWDGWSSASFDSTNVGNTANVQTFTIRNLGDANLTGLALSTSGSHGADFSAYGLSTTTLAPGASTTFSISFKPKATGSRTATLSVANNDANESPFDISLRGTGTSGPVITAPEIAIQAEGGSNLTDGSSNVLFASTVIGNSATAQTFTIRNLGDANLTGLALTKSGSNSDDFSVSGLSKTTLAPGASTTFNVNFKPTAAGTRSATLRVASNDANESPFDIALSGIGNSSPDKTAPEIAIQGAGGSDLADGNSDVVFASTTVGNSASAQILTIRNLGNANLTGLALSKSGGHSADFTVSGLSKTTLAPGASTTFSVNFKPTAAGARNAALRVASNDANENPFDISLSGTGTEAGGGGTLKPEIEVALMNSEPVILTSGESTGHFGKVRLRAAARKKYFMIRNTGTSTLSGLEIASLGKNASQFVTGKLATSSLAPNESTEFWVAFKPKQKGKKEAMLQIASNDADESTFEINLSGKGLPSPKIGILTASGEPVAARKAVVNRGSWRVGRRKAPKRFTITNDGSSTLKKLSMVTTGIHKNDFLIGDLKVDSLAPGESTTFRIAFKPGAEGRRRAFLLIQSNDPENARIRIKLKGRGKALAADTVASSLKRGSTAAKAKASAPPVESYSWNEGGKYRTLTIARSSGSTVTSESVQVSSNLVDWFSGSKHTTVIKDDASLLKVRDNTPLSPGSKRYIRIRPNR